MNAKRVTAIISFFGMVAGTSVTPAAVCAQSTLESVAGAHAAAVVIGGEIYRRSQGPFDFAPTPSR